MFDIYLPVVALAPVMFMFQPKNLSPQMETVLASLVFITTLLGRPIGALIFGLIADKVGRRAASIYSVAGFGVITLLIGLLPGYETLGLASYILLVLLRFLDGIFLGGGYTGAMPLAIEYSKKDKRGFVGGLIIAGFPAAYVSINLITMLMFYLFPLDGPGSPYTVWGWRIPFIVGAALAGLLALYYVHKVSESEVWKKEAAAGAEQAEASPMAGLLSGKGGRDLLQVLLLMTGFWTTQNIITIYMPTGLLVKTLHLNGFALTATLMICYTILFFSYIGSGLLGQVIGRRRVLRDRRAADRDGGRIHPLHADRHARDGVRHPRAAGQPPGGDRDLALGRHRHLHQRALRHGCPRHRLRHRLQPLGGDPVLLRLLHGLAERADAARADARGPADRRRPDRHRGRAHRPGDQGRRFRHRPLSRTPRGGRSMNGNRIGFIGLGNMGGRMTRRLTGAGIDVVGFDTDRGGRRALGRDGRGLDRRGRR
ncbi:MAG: MFS transporter [Methylobacterium radiotolerans]